MTEAAPPGGLAQIELGRVAYADALALQRALVERRRARAAVDGDPARGDDGAGDADADAGDAPRALAAAGAPAALTAACLAALDAQGGGDLVLYVEHPEVVTTGRRAQLPTRDAAELAPARAAGLEVVEVERGGAATWHGPGQLVGYPIVALGPALAVGRDLHAYLRALEGALADAIGALTGLEAGPRPGLTGVWVGDRKVASIGVACRGWVTFHGFALNLDVDLARFALFRPCDLEPRVMASLASLGHPVTRDAAREAVHAALARRLGLAGASPVPGAAPPGAPARRAARSLGVGPASALAAGAALLAGCPGPPPTGPGRGQAPAPGELGEAPPGTASLRLVAVGPRRAEVVAVVASHTRYAPALAERLVDRAPVTLPGLAPAAAAAAQAELAALGADALVLPGPPK